MTKINCSGIIFYTPEGKILLEDRRRINKHGEHWSFFGGSCKEGETKEQTLKREINEELSYDITDASFFGEYRYLVPDKPLELTYYVFTAKLPDISKFKVHSRAGMKLFTVKQALRLKMVSIDKKIIEDFATWFHKR